MTLFGQYSGKEFLDKELKKREWLVEKIIRENDSVIFVGNEKSGKSLFIFQLICSLTTKHPLIDKYEVPKECKVTYIQIEGELSDSQDRMKRMIKTQEFNPDNFHLMFLAPLELHQRGFTLGLRDTILAYWKKQCDSKPDIIIIDPLYFAFIGSLSDDEVVRQFIGNLRILKDSLDCALVIVHHTHKQKWDYIGGIIEEGDDAIFGSKFLKAWADHTLLFIYDKKKDIRILSCNTQRSGDIVKECNLKLIEPEPLYFEEIGDKEITHDLIVLNFLQRPEYENGLCCDDICKYLNISRQTFYKSIKMSMVKNLIVKNTVNRPVLYRFNCEELNNKITAPAV